MPRTRKTSGFALLLVLLVIVVAGTALAATARRQGLLAIQALHAQRDCQLRWGMLSCRAFALPRAEKILDAAGQETDAHPAEATLAVVLGGMTFDLVVGDEQAKVNVNLLAQDLPEQDLRQRLQSVLSGKAPDVTVHLVPLEEPAVAPVSTRPAGADNQTPVTVRRYASLDQVFQYDGVALLFGSSPAAGSPVRRRVTCWGSGQLNVRRAPLEAIRAVVGDVLDDADVSRLAQSVAEKDKDDLGAALAELGLDKEQLDRVKPRLTYQSNCHSLWIRADDGFRRYYRLYVQMSTEGEPPRLTLFVWQRS